MIIVTFISVYGSLSYSFVGNLRKSYRYRYHYQHYYHGHHLFQRLHGSNYHAKMG